MFTKKTGIFCGGASPIVIKQQIQYDKSDQFTPTIPQGNIITHLPLTSDATDIHAGISYNPSNVSSYSSDGALAIKSPATSISLTNNEDKPKFRIDGSFNYTFSYKNIAGGCLFSCYNTTGIFPVTAVNGYSVTVNHLDNYLYFTLAHGDTSLTTLAFSMTPTFETKFVSVFYDADKMEIGISVDGSKYKIQKIEREITYNGSCDLTLFQYRDGMSIATSSLYLKNLSLFNKRLTTNELRNVRLGTYPFNFIPALTARSFN